MTLVDKLSRYSPDFWDFSQYRDKYAIIKYPAMMVAPMQEQLLQVILESDESISNILDPFAGSGTVLSIGKKLGLDVKGIDINPLATLITRVRLEGVPSDLIHKHIAQLRMYITLLLGNTPPFEFPNINKWFRDDVIADLSVIRKAIQLEKSLQIRRFFWVCFADTVIRYSNTRSTTFKLHIKELEKIKSMNNDSIDYFINKASTIYNQYITYHKYNNQIELYTGDAIEILSNFNENSIDLICTSPPYGDNHTTVTYGQFSILPLLWIDSNDLEKFDKNLLNNFSAIDSASMGGKIKTKVDDSLYKDLLKNITPRKAKKVISFFDDYCQAFAQMARVLKRGKRLVLTLGNRRVDNIELPFDILNDRLAAKYGLEKEAIITRNIQGKRMPSKLSHIPNLGAVTSMKKEYVIIYKKL